MSDMLEQVVKKLADVEAERDAAATRAARAETIQTQTLNSLLRVTDELNYQRRAAAALLKILTDSIYPAPPRPTIGGNHDPTLHKQAALQRQEGG